MFATQKKFSDENKYSAKGSNGRRSESSTSRSSANSLWTGIATKAARPTSTLQRQCDKCDNEPISIQTKLKIGPVDDPYEREADQVAEQVMRKPASEELEETPSVETSQSNGPVIRRACDDCEKNDVLRSNTSSNVDKLVQSPGSGSPLKDDIRSRIEPVLGADLSSVRVHNDARSQQAASDINAKAFTHRNNVYLGPGQSSNDLGLMAHEATHTVQQSHDQRVHQSIQRQEVTQENDLDQWRPSQVDADVIGRLLAPDSPIWRQLNPAQGSTLNCPATAAAVDNYLSTGQIEAAHPGDPMGHFNIVNRLSDSVSLARLILLLGQPNTFLVVFATRPANILRENPGLTPNHWFILLNYDGRIRVLDAYGANPGDRGSPQQYARQQGFSSYQYYRGRFRVTFVPFDDFGGVLD